ncbi:MAG: response regulator [Denitrovibrio sp.]|nr:MAG: response regulator [Denitrovibrio sp.]
MKKVDKTILIVEDDDVARCVLGLIFNKHFEKVITAVNGEEGLALYKDLKPDLVLLDLAMPVIDGFGMIKYLRENNPEQALIILTAFREEAEGIVDYTVLYKPVGRATLLSAVSVALSVDIMD